MRTILRDSIARRRELVAGCLAFIVGLLAIAAGIIYLHVRYVIPELGWEGIVHCFVSVLRFSFLGGLALAAVVFVPLNRWHHYQGIYRCNLCGRPLKCGVICQCFPETFRSGLKRKALWRRRYRKKILAVLLAYALLLFPAIPIAISAYHHGRSHFILDLLISHALVCGLSIAVVGMVMEGLEAFKVGRRVRKRWAVFRQLLAVWPLIAIVVIIVCKIMGVLAGSA